MHTYFDYHILFVYLPSFCLMQVLRATNTCLSREVVCEYATLPHRLHMNFDLIIFGAVGNFSEEPFIPRQFHIVLSTSRDIIKIHKFQA